jgi:hypothetical protein
MRIAMGEDITRQQFEDLPANTHAVMEDEFGADWITDMIEIAMEKRATGVFA